MAIRQYIGARYVPKFVGTYNVTTEYEALSVVDNGEETSYISSKPVPAGTPLTNRDYWQVYGSSNGAIIHLQDQIDVLNAKLGSFTSFKNKHIIFMGDSYSEGAICTGLNPDTYTRNYSDGWMYKLINYLDMDSDHVIASYQGGASFALQGGIHWQDTLENLPVYDPDSIDMIIVCGGANDFPENETAIKSGITDFCEVAKTRFPNAIVLIGMIGFSGWSSSVVPAYKTLTAYQEGATENNALYIVGCENIAHYHPFFSLDNLHLTADGYTAIARYLANYLQTGNADFIKNGTSTFTPTIAGGNVLTLNECATEIHNNLIEQRINILNLEFTATNISLGLDWIELGRIDDSCIIGRAGFGVITPCTLIFRHAGGFRTEEGYAKLVGNILSVRCTRYDNDNNSWVSLSNCNDIQLLNVHFITDAFNVL